MTAGASEARAREALTRFIDQELKPDDLIVVMKPLDSLFDIRLTHDFESAGRLIAAFHGRRGDFTPRNAYEQNYMAGDPDRIETARLQVALSAINALAVSLGPLSEERKNLIVVTEALAQPARRRGQEYLTTLETAIRSANRSHVSVYVVDPRERPVDPANEAEGRRAMQLLASDTDGPVIDTDLHAGLQRVARESRAYYLLTYRSAHKEDGQFHTVDVHVKRPGVEVRARAGYWAPSLDDALRAALVTRAHEPKAPPRLEPAPHISPLIQPWFGLALGGVGKTRVTFVWEPAPRVPGDRTERPPSRIELTALAADDTVLFEGPVLPIRQTAADARNGQPARAVFDAAPGRLRLRMKIDDEASKQIDSDVREFAIRDWRAAVAIGTPEVLRARNARELRSLDADPDATPVARRDFSRVEHLLIRFPVYAPPGDEALITAKLLGQAGQVMRDLRVDVASAPEGRNQVGVPLANLAPGEYVIELAATSRAGDARDRLRFRVTN